MSSHHILQSYPPQLLDDYLSVVERRAPGSLLATALRTGSQDARLLFARAATRRTTSMFEVLAAVRQATRDQYVRPSEMDVRWLAELARLVALQEILPDDRADGLALYDLALEQFGPELIPAADQGVHAQLAYSLAFSRRASDLLATYASVPQQVRSYLDIDLANPHKGLDGATRADWAQAFGGLFPDPRPAFLPDHGPVPFDQLVTPAVRNVDDEGKVSVVITSFRPGGELLTAVRSIINQSWSNLEILLVDDGSPSEYGSILDQCVTLDARVKLIRLDANAGTYMARNVAMDAATGDFVTFQDSDDWSHPKRIEEQVRLLLQDKTLMATVSEALKVTEHLSITKPGRNPRVMCTSSMMFRRRPTLAKIGYMDSVRKSADTEYLRRIEVAFTLGSVHRIRDSIYALIRQHNSSLSACEFREGWIHPARFAYRSAYTLWHEQIAAGSADPYLPKDLRRRPFPAPSHIRQAGAELTTKSRYDVILASDWRPFGGPQKSMLEEIAALTRQGMRVGVLNIEAYRFMTTQRKSLCRPIQELINDGTVGHVLHSDEVETSLLVVRYPPVLQFPAATASRIKANRLLILANQAPSELDGTDLRYVPATCTMNARKMFSVEPEWCPQGPNVRKALAASTPQPEITEFDMPGIIDTEKWCLERTGYRSDQPIIGRHSRDTWTKWPQDRRELLQAYPDSTPVDVRIMGGAKTAQELLAKPELPANWLVYDYDEVSVRSFLFQIDFYVYFPHPRMIEAFGRAILEALASGCVVILPPHFVDTFGDAALYCNPGDVLDVVKRYYSNRKLFLSQSRLAQERVRQRYSHETYVAQIVALSQQKDSGDSSAATSIAGH
jgi:O-antigen biosynthesis protein